MSMLRLGPAALIVGCWLAMPAAARQDARELPSSDACRPRRTLWRRPGRSAERRGHSRSLDGGTCRQVLRLPANPIAVARSGGRHVPRRGAGASRVQGRGARQRTVPSPDRNRAVPALADGSGAAIGTDGGLGDPVGAGAEEGYLYALTSGPGTAPTSAACGPAGRALDHRP